MQDSLAELLRSLLVGVLGGWQNGGYVWCGSLSISVLSNWHAFMVYGDELRMRHLQDQLGVGASILFEYSAGETLERMNANIEQSEIDRINAWLSDNGISLLPPETVSLIDAIRYTFRLFDSRFHENRTYIHH